MACGLQVFDENGQIIVDVNSCITKVLGIGDTGVEDGAIVNEGLSLGYFWMLPIKYWMPETLSIAYPSFRCNSEDNTLLWTFSDSSSGRRARMLFMYGIF